MTLSTARIALAQTNAVLGDKQANLQRMEYYCHRAAEQNAKLICFPELATTGYRQDLLDTRLWDLSETLDGETSRLFSKLSHSLDITIVSGFIERGSYFGQVYNSAAVWVPTASGVSGVFRKVHAFGSEKQWFTSGNSYPVFDTPIGRIGIMICYDMGFSEVARILTLHGAELLLAPSAWCVQDSDVWDINIACRALENGIHVAGVNRWGHEEDLHLFGGSKVAGPRGQTLVSASTSDEELLICDIDFQAQAHTRLRVPYLKDRRPDTYYSLVDNEE